MKTTQTTKGQSEEPEIYRNGEGNPVIFANKAQAIRKALELGEDWSVHQSPESRRFYVRKLAASASQNHAEPQRHIDYQLYPPSATSDGKGWAVTIGGEYVKVAPFASRADAEAYAKSECRKKESSEPESAQHSPLPWDWFKEYQSAQHDERNGSTIRSMSKSGVHFVAKISNSSLGGDANAALIVRSVNNAGALAEALRGMTAAYKALREKPFRIVALVDNAEEALAQWEKASQ